MKKFNLDVTKIAPCYSELAIVILAVQVLMMIKPMSWILNIILFMSSIILFAICKDNVSEGKKKFGMMIVHGNILVFGWSMCTYLVYLMEKSLGANSALGLLPVLLCGIVLLAYLAFITSEKGKQLFSDMYNNEVKIGGGKREEVKLQPGDVVLAKEKYTGEDIVLYSKDRFLHMLVLGATGTGKTSQILLPMIYQDMKNTLCGITVLEPKSDLAEKVFMMAKHMGREVQYFNPTLKDCPYFNPLYGPEEIVVENIATTFGMFDTDSSSYFRDMADTLIRNGLRVVKRLKGNDATFLDFATILFNAEQQGKNMVMEFKRLSTPTPEIRKENDDVASWFLNEYYNEKSKTYEHCSGLRTKVNKLISNKFLRKVLNPPPGTPKEAMIDFDAHLAGTNVLAMATEQGVLGNLGDFLGFFLILSFQSAVLKRPGNEDTRISNFFYVDEVQCFANPGFSNLLTQGRSYRVSSVLATQALDQLGMNAGKAGAAFIQLVTTNARNIVLFPGCNGKDAKYYSDQFGEHEVTEISKSTSSQKTSLLHMGPTRAPSETKSERTSKKAMYSPSDLIFREFGEVTLRLIKKNTLQYPQIGKVSYIPKELNTMLDEQILIYKDEQKYKPGEIDEAIECNEGNILGSNLAIPDVGEDLPIGLEEAVEFGEAVLVDTDIAYDSDFTITDDGVGEIIEDDFF